MQVSAASMAQKVSLSLKNASLETVIRQLKSQTGYNFVVRESVLNSAKPVTIDVSRTELTDVLDEIFENQPLTFDITDKTVVVKEKEVSVFDRIKGYFASINVGGRVVDENGQGLSGVTISMKEGKGTVTSDALGGFYIKNVDEDAILIFTYVGYTKKELPIKGKENLGIIGMSPSTSKLDEVQVIFGGTTSRRISTAGVTTITKDEIKAQPIDNPLLALQGRVPGLIVTPASGAPGAAMNVQLRGQNSLNGTRSEPLYVVNGVPVANNIYGVGGYNGAGGKTISALSFLNTEDIESIDVLKDADATAIYGSRGANGVILITTKKGKIGAARINVDLSTSFSEATRRLDLMNTQQYLELRREAFKNDGIDFNVSPFNTPEFKYQYAPDLFLWDQNKDTNWQQKLIGGTAKNRLAQLSITGGSEFVQYTVGGNYNNQSYILPGDAKDENAGGYINLTGRSLNQKLTLNLSSNFSFNRNISPAVEPIINLAPNAPDPYTELGDLNWEPNPLTGVATWSNPFRSIANPTRGSVLSMNQNATVTYNVVSGLSLKGQIGFNQVKGDSFTPTPLTTFDPATWGSPTAVRSSAFGKTNSSSLVIEPQIFYKKNVSSGILDILMGGSYQSRKDGQEYVNARGFASDGLLHNLLSATDIFGLNNSTEYKYIGFYGRLSYNWKEKYLFNFNVRRDGSSRFGPKNRFGNFGSIAGAWVFTNEKWFKKNFSILSYGKLRSSYGITGNDAIQDYQYLEAYENIGSSIEQILYQGLQTIKSTGVSNPYFKWETVKKLEFGLDLGIVDDRLLVSGTYYRNRCDNQIGPFISPSTTGAGTAQLLVNLPWKIQNSGWEFSLSSTNIKAKDFNWNSSINLSIPRNKLLTVADDRLLLGNVQGQPFSGVLSGYRALGVDPETGLYTFAGHLGETLLGADGNVDYYGSRTAYFPRFFGGIQNTFRFRKLTFNIFAQFSKQGGININVAGLGGSAYIPGYFNQNQPVALVDRWRQAGDIVQYGKATTFLGTVTQQADQFITRSQMAIVDASFIRLKNASISYQLIQDGQSSKIKSLSIELRGQNLLTITNYIGYDPEVQSTAFIPQLRTVSLGLTIGL